MSSADRSEASLPPDWLSAFFDKTHMGVLFCDAVGVVVAANPAAAGMQGRSVGEVISMPILSMYAPEDQARVREAIAEADRVGRVCYEARMQRKDGSTYPVQMDVVTVCDAAGVPLYRVATQQDISERWGAELRISQLNRLYATLSQINQTIVRVDTAAELFTAVCRLAIEYGDFQLAWIGLYDPQSGRVTPAAMSQLLRCEGINAHEPPHRDGLIGWALLQGAIVHASDAEAGSLRCWNEPVEIAFRSGAIVPLRQGGRVIGLLALYAAEPSFFTFADELRLLGEIGLDISFALDLFEREGRRFRAEADLVESEAALRKSQAMAHVGHWSWDTRTNLVTWSDEMHWIFGVEPGAAALDLNDVIARAIHPDDRERVERANSAVIQKNAPAGMEYRVVWPDGSVRTVWAQPGETVQDADGAVVRLTGIVQDITERKAAEVQIRQQAQRLEILADASRDFASALFDDRGVLERIVRRVSEALDGNCYIRLINADGVRLDLAALYDSDADVRQVAQVLLGAAQVRVDGPGLGAHVIERGEPVFLPMTTPEQLLPMMAPELRPLLNRFPVHSLIATPLNAQGERIGVMSLARYRRDQAPFTEQDLHLLQDLADRAALAISHAHLLSRLEEELHQHALAEQALRESETRLQTVFDASPDAVFISDMDGRFLEVNSIAVARYGYARDEILQMTVRGLAPAGEQEGVLQDLRQALETGQPLQRRGRKKDGSEIDEEIVLRPFTLQGRPCVYASVRDISERIQSQQRLQLQFERLQALRAIDLMITSNFDIRPTLTLLLDQVIAQLNADAAAVLLFNESLQTLDHAAGRGFRGRAIEQTRLRLGRGYAGRAGIERQTVFIADIQAAKADFARSDLLADEGFRAYCGAPLIAKGRMVGVLEVFQRSVFAGDPEWIGFLETLAGQAAIAIDDARLFNDLQRSNAELRLAYDATIEGWSRAMDLRDQETEGHTRRVTDLTMLLAEAAGLSADQIAHARRGALLHDIGKLGIPDRILFKADALTGDEWAIMSRHPQYAYDMLSSIEYLRPALDIPYCHHEKWDGTGYPRRLKGEQIPLAARIFMVADVWDALRSDRPYRRAWPEAEVIDYIRQQSGSHFDPMAVSLFFKVHLDRQRTP